MTTLAEFMIVAGKDHGCIILNSVKNGPLIWPTVEQEDGTVRLKTYEELSYKEKLQADCDLKATNIVLQGLPPDVYSLVNHHKVSKDIWDRVKLLMQGTSLSKQECFAVLTFLPGDDPIACMNKAMAFFSAVFSPRYPSTNNQLRSSSNPRNQATVQDGRVTIQQVQRRQGQNVVDSGTQGNATSLRRNTSGQAKVFKRCNCQGEGHMARQCTQPKRRRDATWFKEKVLLVQAQAEDGQVAQIITHNATFQTDDLDAYDSNCDDISSAKAVLMANLLSCDSDVLSE
ncbi:integrase, catalytic region, zinc finger, CCHC-type containing protein, partial [Tanacetum coccineum]